MFITFFRWILGYEGESDESHRECITDDNEESGRVERHRYACELTIANTASTAERTAVVQTEEEAEEEDVLAESIKMFGETEEKHQDPYGYLFRANRQHNSDEFNFSEHNANRDSRRATGNHNSLEILSQPDMETFFSAVSYGDSFTTPLTDQERETVKISYSITAVEEGGEVHHHTTDDDKEEEHTINKKRSPSSPGGEDVEPYEISHVDKPHVAHITSEEDEEEAPPALYPAEEETLHDVQRSYAFGEHHGDRFNAVEVNSDNAWKMLENRFA
ncbi:hypothetical protein AGDE_13877 [Angomonas deanei]|nr:hypothetical protein AGDE_13877 [Angomonas deanei]|eukprot:EPY21676.1 hypothetical protein AGDE_13877 [Angomonas deanei]